MPRVDYVHVGRVEIYVSEMSLLDFETEATKQEQLQNAICRQDEAIERLQEQLYSLEESKV